MISLKAYAKINLFLDIASLRTDGYHDIVSFMQTVSLADTVVLEPCDRITVSGNPAVTESSDLTYRAAEAFFGYTGIRAGVKITLSKRIPIQGGLAGGSADAAAVLRGLDRMYNTALNERCLAEIGLSVGSDVPFCVTGGSRLAYGRGEILMPAPPLFRVGIVIVASRSGCSTPLQFAALDGIHGADGYSPDTARLEALCDAVGNKDFTALCQNMYNIFENTEGYDRATANILKRAGAEGVLLSGSGGSVFGLFESPEAAVRAAGELNGSGLRAFACEPVNNYS